WRSVMVMMVLLNEACTWAMPSAMFLRTFLRTRAAALDCCLAMEILQTLLFLQRLGSLARTLARARIGLGALATHRQAAAMAEAAVAADVHQALDVHRRFAAQVTFDGELANLVAHLFELGVGQVLDLPAVLDAGSFADLASTGTPDAEDGGQADLSMLVWRNVDTCNTCHVGPLKAQP